MPSLFVIRGNDQGTRYELENDRIDVGRDATSTLQLHDLEVSRHHAEIVRRDRYWVVRDLGSSNGTFVNGTSVGEQRLSSGDQVQMGKTVMLYTGPSEDSEHLHSEVDIIAQDQGGENSRILRSMSHEEGSQILDFREVDASESPWLARARSNLQVMYRTALAVSHTLDIDQLLTRIMHLIFEWLDADRGCVMLIDAVSEKLVPTVHLSRKGGRETEEKITISQTILDYVLEHKEGVLTTDAREDDRWNPAASILKLGIREAICVPMQGRYGMVGVIYIDSSTTPQRVVQMGGNKFTDEHLKLMIAIAHQAALAVEDTRYYSAMVHAERLAAVGQTIATLSHHIKNILQGIRGGSFLIKDGLSRHDENMVRKGWEFVEKNQERISNLVLDMLTFSKEREPEMAPAELNEVAGDVVELMQSRAKDLEVELRWKPDATMPTLTFDPEGIHRALLNVVTNAIDACDESEHPCVEVSTEYLPDRGVAQIRVADNGGGIAPEDREKIFTIFMSTKKSRGTGLGLAVSHKILQEHGGQIRVDSEVGKGSCFTFELPANVVESPSSTGEHARP